MDTPSSFRYNNNNNGMSKQEIISKHFETYIDPVVSDLEVMIQHEKGLNAPIVLVVFSLIDALGRCLYGSDTSSGVSLFLRGYMVRIDGRYSQHSEILEKVFRNGLAHTGVPYPGGGVARDREDIHLTIKTTLEGACIIVDADTFFDHFKKSVELYKEDLLTNEDVYNKFTRWLDWLRDNPPEEIGDYLRSKNYNTYHTASVAGATPCMYPMDKLES